MWLLEHGFGKETLIGDVNDHWPSLMINLSVGAHYISSLRRLHFISTITQQIG